MNKIAIVGSSGAGKSTFAKMLSKKINVKAIYLDNLYYKSQTIIKFPSDWDSIQKKLVKSRKWIIDGNFPRTWWIRLKAADTVIFFDFPVWLSLYRVIRRRIQYNKISRPDMPSNVMEKLRFNDIKKILFFPKPDVLIKFYKLNNKKLIFFKNNNEADRFLNSL